MALLTELLRCSPSLLTFGYAMQVVSRSEDVIFAASKELAFAAGVVEKRSPEAYYYY